MDCQIRKLSSSSGASLIMILIVISVMGVFAITILSQSMSETKTTRTQVDQIVAEQLAKGALWNSYDNHVPGSAIPATTTSSVNLNGRTYDTVVAHPAGTNNVTVTVNY